MSPVENLTPLPTPRPTESLSSKEITQEEIARKVGSKTIEATKSRPKNEELEVEYFQEPIPTPTPTKSMKLKDPLARLPWEEMGRPTPTPEPTPTPTPTIPPHE
ncbi:hypothetical protein J6T21_03290 [Candidatus Saccharibacteria bacterium]|nr:hypothetical protein [Candidatus Saccharibacteria bacterium]